MPAMEQLKAALQSPCWLALTRVTESTTRSCLGIRRGPGWFCDGETMTINPYAKRNGGTALRDPKSVPVTCRPNVPPRKVMPFLFH